MVLAVLNFAPKMGYEFLSFDFVGTQEARQHRRDRTRLHIPLVDDYSSGKRLRLFKTVLCETTASWETGKR